ncbi:GAF domain-containing protein [Tateyamaria sp. SN6-1]|uniref:GAF domain-containing protein n=1 Tax=Tateyamaria sp. SN6-1 TaxID=3092148 RepID=UPI0039F54814
MQDFSHNFSSLPEFDALAESVAARLNCDLALVSIVHEDVLLSMGHSSAPDTVEARMSRTSDTVCGRTVASGRVLRLPDIRRDPELSRLPAVAHFGIGAYLGVPLRREDSGIVGALCAINMSPRIWRDSEAEYLTLAADLAESKIDRQLLRFEQKALSAALAENDAVLAALSGLRGKAFTVHNDQGELVFANSAMETELGLGHRALMALPEVAQSVANAGKTEADLTVDLPERPATPLRVNVVRGADGLTLADWSRGGAR